MEIKEYNDTIKDYNDVIDYNGDAQIGSVLEIAPLPQYQEEAEKEDNKPAFQRFAENVRDMVAIGLDTKPEDAALAASLPEPARREAAIQAVDRTLGGGVAAFGRMAKSGAELYAGLGNTLQYVERKAATGIGVLTGDSAKFNEEVMRERQHESMKRVFGEESTKTFTGLAESPIGEMASMMGTLALGNIGTEMGLTAALAKIPASAKWASGLYMQGLVSKAPSISMSTSQALLGKYGAGAVTRAVAENVGGSALTAPIWALKYSENDAQYIVDYGTVGSGATFDTVLGVALGSARASRLVAAARKASFEKATVPVTKVVHEMVEGFKPVRSNFESVVHSYGLKKNITSTMDITDDVRVQAVDYLNENIRKNVGVHIGMELDNIDAANSVLEAMGIEGSEGFINIRKVGIKDAEKGVKPDIWVHPSKGVVESAAEGAVGYRFVKHSASAEDYALTATKLRKTLATKSATKSFITDSDELFSGTAPTALLDIVQNVGKTDPELVGKKALLQSYKQATARDPLRSSITAFGEYANKIRMNAKQRYLDVTPTWSKVLAMAPSEADPITKEFFSLYDAVRNRSWDILEQANDGNNILLRLDKSSEYNKAMARKLGLEDVPEYVPSLQDVNLPAKVKDRTIAGSLTHEWIESERQIANGFNHVHVVDKTAPVYNEFYTRIPKMKGEELWRAVDVTNDNPAAREYYTFTSEEAAKKFVARKGAGWKATRGSAELEAIGKAGSVNKQELWTTTGHGRGHWQGDMQSVGLKALLEIREDQIRSVDKAVRKNVEAYSHNIFEAVEMTMDSAARNELRQVMVGNAPEQAFNKTLDALMTTVGDGLNAAFKGKIKDNYKLDPMLLPDNPERFKLRQWLSKTTRNIGQYYYSVANISGSAVNYLSTLQAMPTAMAWYNKSSAETLLEWQTRTRLVGKELSSVGYFDGATIGYKALQKLAAGGDDLTVMIAEARKAGVLTGDVELLQQALNPMGAKQSTLGKAKEIASTPIKISEEHSRLVGYAIGKEYAESVLKQKGKAAAEFAAGFVDNAFGGFSPLSRVGLTNSSVGQHLSMFTTYAVNNLMKNWDMLVDKEYAKIAAANITNQLMFGAETMPMLKSWTEAHGQDEELAVNVMYNLGFAGTLGFAIGERMDSDQAQLVSGLTRPALFEYWKGWYNTVSDIASDIQATGEFSGSVVAESIANNAPILALRRGMQGALGYTTTRSGLVKTDARDSILERAAMIAGIKTTGNTILETTDRAKREQEIATANAVRQFRKSVGVRVRSGDYDSLGGLIESALRTEGCDVNTITAAVASALETANDATRTRLLKSLFSDIKNPAVLAVLANLEEAAQQGFDVIQ